MKKKIGVAIVNVIETMLLLVINYQLDVDFFLHICILAYAWVRFCRGIVEVYYLWGNLEK